MPHRAPAYDDTIAAYQGVDDLESFAPEQLAVYRAALLERSAAQVAFLTARLAPGARVLEVGCGNGRLLVGLAENGVLGEGVGVDVASSRIAFARAWAAATGRDEQLRFTVADVLSDELPAGPFDAVLCVTGAFAYFEPMRAGAGAQVLRALRAVLDPAGVVVLELYPHPDWRRLLRAAGRELRLWSELGAEDPWRFYLSRLGIDDAGSLRHEKIFVHRTTGQIDDSRREHLRLYSGQELAALLLDAGLTPREELGGWEAAPYTEGSSELLVVTASA